MSRLQDFVFPRYSIYRTAREAGIEPTLACAVAECMAFPEKDDELEPAEDRYEPTEEDWQDYVSWSDRLDRDSWTMEGDEPNYLSDRDVLVATGCVG